MTVRMIGRCLGPWLALALLWPSTAAPQVVERVIDGDTFIVETVGTVPLRAARGSTLAPGMP